MTPDELIQLMRTTSLSDVRSALSRIQKRNPGLYDVIVYFYTKSVTKKAKK